jgi:hypothetical protein
MRAWRRFSELHAWNPGWFCVLQGGRREDRRLEVDSNGRLSLLGKARSKTHGEILFSPAALCFPFFPRLHLKGTN